MAPILINCPSTYNFVINKFGGSFMCGFVGWFNYIGKKIDQADRALLEKMTKSIGHRGPDDTRYFYDDFLKAGFNRLSIIDIEGGRQPMASEDEGLWIVFNGEIYNYISLRADLIKKGYQFSTNSDTEIILKLYKEKGEELLKDLRGMYSFVIYDSIKNLIFGARDPFGIKPLYYMEREDCLYFASEKKSFMELLGEDQVNLPALQHYLTFQYVPEPSTMSVQIHKLEAGCCFLKSLDFPLKITKYFHPKLNPSTISKDITPRIKDALVDSVRAHMISDVPLGCFLSGGVDSTAIVSIAKEFKPDIKTFTVAFDVPGYSELDIAQESAKRLGVENIHYIVGWEEYIKELPKIIWHMDDPLADPSVVPLYFVSREASKHVKVVLSGEGADELFGGYNIYREPQSLRLFNYIPSPLKKGMKFLAQGLPEGLKGKSFIERGCTPLEARYIGNAKMYEEKEKRQILIQYSEDLDYQSVTKPLYDTAGRVDEMTKMQYIDINTWLKGDILLKADKMTMAHSLELRVPFLDREVFDCASTLHSSMKTSNNSTKYILREALRDIVPSHVIDRKKLGFPVPIRHWLKNEIFDWARELIDKSQTHHILDKGFALRQLEDHRRGRVDYSRRLWTLLIFMIWHQVFVEKVYDFDKDRANPPASKDIEIDLI